MAYNPIDVKDRVVQYPDRKKLTNIAGDFSVVYDVEREEGEVYIEGDRVDTSLIQRIQLAVKLGFDSLAPIAASGDYNDLINKPVPSEDTQKPAGWVQGNKPYYDNSFNVRNYPADGTEPDPNQPSGRPGLARFDEDTGEVTCSVELTKGGVKIFNSLITVTQLEYYTDDPQNAGFKIAYSDDSALEGKFVVTPENLVIGVEYSNGLTTSIVKKDGGFPGFEAGGV